MEDEEVQETVDTCAEEEPANARLLVEEDDEVSCGEVEVIDSECTGSTTETGECVDTTQEWTNWDG